MGNLGAFYIALALAFGLSDVASAIRHANISVHFTAPMVVTTTSPTGADDGPR